MKVKNANPFDVREIEADELEVFLLVEKFNHMINHDKWDGDLTLKENLDNNLALSQMIFDKLKREGSIAFFSL